MGGPVALNKEAGKENEQTLANLHPAEEATSNDEFQVEIETFCKRRNPKALNIRLRATLINAWTKFCESLKESRAIENIPANELDLPMSKFFISVREQVCTEFEPCTFSGFQRSFQRHWKTKSVLPLQHSKMSSQSNKTSVRQFSPEHILTSLKAAHSTSTFSVVISRRSQG